MKKAFYIAVMGIFLCVQPSAQGMGTFAIVGSGSGESYAQEFKSLLSQAVESLGVCSETPLEDVAEHAGLNILDITDSGELVLPPVCYLDREHQIYIADKKDLKKVLESPEAPWYKDPETLRGFTIGCTGAAVLATNYLMPGTTQATLSTTAMGEYIKGYIDPQAPVRTMTIAVTICGISYLIDYAVLPIPVGFSALGSLYFIKAYKKVTKELAKKPSDKKDKKNKKKKEEESEDSDEE